MAVRVRLPRLDTTNVRSFSVQEDATPIEPSSSAGGVGQIGFNLIDFEDGPLLIGNVVLADGARGKTSGTVTSVVGNNADLQVTADSILGLFNTNRTAQPFVGTLGALVQYYCDMVEIPNDVLTDAAIATRPVTYPGWFGNAWVYVKQMLAKEQIEMALVFDRVYVRPLRQITANQERMSTAGYSVSNTEAAQNVETNYYNYVSGVQQEVYPLVGQDPQIFVVNSGETQVFTQQLTASLSSVNQPVVQTSVANTTFAGTDGVYSVSGNDGLPVNAAQWTAEGGSLSVRITDDPSVIEVTIKGATNTTLAPFRIAMSAGSSSFYNSLHITGTGVTWNKQSVIIPTGVTPDQASDVMAVTVDNVFISSYQDAINLGIKAAQAHAGLQYTVSGTAYDLNRDGSGDALIQATVGDFNVAYAGYTVTMFNTLWSGQTIEQFNEYWQDQVDLLWGNQLFGNAPGARIMGKEANFRISSATTTESAVQFTAQLDTLVSDFNSKWSVSTPNRVRVDMSTNPSFESNTTGWSGGAASITRDNAWAQVGSWSGKVTPTSASADTFISMGGDSGAVRLGMQGGRTYTVQGTLRLATPQTGTLHATRARRIVLFTKVGVAGYVETMSTQAPNLAGVYPQSFTFTVPVGVTEAFIRFYNGASNTAANDVWWDAVMLEETPSTEPYFDGSTSPVTVDHVSTVNSWTGAANNSTSTQSYVTTAFTVADFNTEFAGYTCQEFSTVPLRMV